MKKIFLSAILAGAVIAFGGTVFLSVENTVVGSLFFTIGLFVVCTRGLHLFTGKVCYVFDNDAAYAKTLPVIWLGGLVSLQFAAPGKPSLLAPLGLCAVGVELGIAAREVLRLVRRFRTAKASSDNPLDWFSDAFSALARNERVARMAALECVMWYYASASWRRAPHVPHGYRAFSSHRQSGYVAAVGVMLVLIAVETVAAHLLAARFSVAAACVLTALSLYTILWMIAEARAVVLNPLLVDDVELVARWGMLVCERIPLDRIARVGSQDPAVPKRELLNLAAMGGQALWIELAEPLEVRGLTGKPRLVRAIKTTPDDAAAFKDALRPRS